MKTSSADVESRDGKPYFFLLSAKLFMADCTCSTEIELPLDAGLRTNRPVTALRPTTALDLLPLPDFDCVFIA